MKLYRCNYSFEANVLDVMGKWVFYGALFLVEHPDDLPGGPKFKHFFTEFLMQVPSARPDGTASD
jgi:hypothetical protein